MNFTKKIKTPLLPEVRNIIKELNSHDIEFSEYRTEIINWLNPIIDLSNFYVYPMNGITEGLNWFMMNTNYNIFKKDGDYEWVDNIKNKNASFIKYITCPSSIDGNSLQIPKDIPIALDIAYVGTTDINKKIYIGDNVEYVFYSLSKSFGLNQYRTGWLFTKKLDIKLNNLIYKNNYYNYYSTLLAEKIIQNFEIDYIHKKFKKKQLEICLNFNLSPSDCVFLAYTKNNKYKKFFRNDVARLCLTEFMVE